jgi:hypothetical protein
MNIRDSVISKFFLEDMYKEDDSLMGAAEFLSQNFQIDILVAELVVDSFLSNKGK